MAGINKVIIVGRLGKDPELRYFQDGTAVANFSVATSLEWKDKETGEPREKTEWHRIAARGRLAEICGQYLAKGRQVYIEGRLQTREWEDKDGNKRWTTEIVAETMQMLGSRSDGSQPGGGQPGAKPGYGPAPGFRSPDSAPSPKTDGPSDPMAGGGYGDDGPFPDTLPPGGGFQQGSGGPDEDIPF